MKNWTDPIKGNRQFTDAENGFNHSYYVLEQKEMVFLRRLQLRLYANDFDALTADETRDLGHILEKVLEAPGFEEGETLR